MVRVFENDELGAWEARRHVDGILDRKDRVFSAVNQQNRHADLGQ